ncbi:hypothetical protein D3C85_1240790 [compost metagenome]
MAGRARLGRHATNALYLCRFVAPARLGAGGRVSRSSVEAGYTDPMRYLYPVRAHGRRSLSTDSGSLGLPLTCPGAGDGLSYKARSIPAVKYKGVMTCVTCVYGARFSSYCCWWVVPRETTLPSSAATFSRCVNRRCPRCMGRIRTSDRKWQDPRAMPSLTM